MVAPDVTWAAVGMAAVSNAAVWLVIIRSIKATKNGSKSVLNLAPAEPGEGKVCQERGLTLERVETKQESYEGDVKEIKKDIREIRNMVRK